MATLGNNSSRALRAECLPGFAISRNLNSTIHASYELAFAVRPAVFPAVFLGNSVFVE